jgi:hypothetical protein
MAKRDIDCKERLRARLVAVIGVCLLQFAIGGAEEVVVYGFPECIEIGLIE